MGQSTKNLALKCCLVLGILAMAGCNLPAQSTTGSTPTPFIFPSATPSPQTGGISGVVWADQCSPPSDGGLTPAGCVATADGQGLVADGVRQSGEPGLTGVVVRLGLGSCPAFGLAVATTSEGGAYQFADLDAGTYCVSIDSSQSENVAAMQSGIWTHPSGSETSSVAGQTITLPAGGDVKDVDFGWGPQVSPGPGGGTATPQPSATETPNPDVTPSMTPTATATLSPGDPKAGLGSPTFSDDFSDPSTWPTYTDDHVSFTIQDGALNMTAANPDFYDGWLLHTPSLSNFYVEITAQFVDVCQGKDHYGIVARGACSGGNCTGYLFTVSCDGNYRLKIWDGSVPQSIYLTPWTASGAIKAGPNQVNVIGLRGDGGKLSMYANGNLLQEIQDPTLEDGLFGVFVGSAVTPDLQVKVDSIDAWQLP